MPITDNPALGAGTASTGAGTASTRLELREEGEGVFSLRLCDEASGNTLSGELIAELLEALQSLRTEGSLKVLILCGTAHSFAQGGRSCCNEAVREKLYERVSAFEYPIIAAMQGDALGAGFLLGAVCDLMVCSESGRYEYSSAPEGVFASEAEEQLLVRRLGRARALDFVYAAGPRTGRVLQEKGWSCPIVPAGQVEQQARRLALSLAKKPQHSLGLLKQHLSREVLELTRALRSVERLPVQELAEQSVLAQNCEGGIELQGRAGHVLLMKMRPQALAAVAEDLCRSFARLASAITNGSSGFRAIVLSGEGEAFLPEACDEQGLLSLQRALLQAPLPVVAVLKSSQSGQGWLLSQLCDAVCYSGEGRYCAAPLMRKPALRALAVKLFADRLGPCLGAQILLSGESYSGLQLQERLRALSVVGEAEVLSCALGVAQWWARFPLQALLEWKSRTCSSLRQQCSSLQQQIQGLLSAPQPMALAPLAGEPEAPGVEDHRVEDHRAELGAVDEPMPLELNSPVISVTVHASGVAVLRMQDRTARNLFSTELIQGLRDAFGKIAAHPRCKVVVLIGYDNYFACGGTREQLISIQQGRARFTDDSTYRAALDCAVPVIACLQGHAVGGGLSLGLFADVVLLSEESQYLSPYMSYGFTPGAGATLIVPHRLGEELGRESLLSAQEYAGSELRKRGVGLSVYPRKQIEAQALRLARQMARQPRAVLIGIKAQLSAAVRERLVDSCEREVAMHDRSLVGQADTLKQIHSNFDPMGSGAPSAPVATGEAAAGGTLGEITAVLKELLAHELHMRSEQIDEDTQFIDLGLDSITGVTWIRKVNEKYATSIVATKIYSYPTLNRLSSYVREEMAKADGPPAIAAPASASDSVTAAGTVAPSTEKSAARFSPKRRAKLISWDNEPTATIDTSTVANGRAPHSAAQGSQPIAVIGMAGRFPEAGTLEQFWDNIAQGRNCISEVPRERWDIDVYFREGEPQPGKTNARWMGLLDDYDRFDPLFFDISPREAISMDPQQRLFLQACWHAIENAGYSTKSLSASKCGVFAGCGPSDYHLLSRELQISAMGFTGGDTSILAARVSYLLDLQGPCLSIETACSSSLVAIAAACDSLVARNSDLALAGGVSVMAGPDLHIKTAQMGMLSKSGRCFTFDQRADGFVPGEGVGVLVLKRLADAQRDEDVILGVIQGWGINQDGKTNGLTAPNPQSQARLQQDVYDRYGIDPAGIQLIEAHGTGTKLGDPIEVDALKQSFAKYTQKKGYCALGSVKSNIGHCFTAAGVVSTIKVLLALQHRQLPPTINFERLNEHIDLSDSPFHVNTRLQDWELNGADRRRAAINSFGFGGTNAHIVVAEYTCAREPAKQVFPLTENGNIIVPLSAKTPRQLQRKALDLLELIRREGQGMELASLAHTLQVARDAMEERVGFLTGSIAELSRQLQSFIAEQPEGESFHTGQVSRDKESLGLLREDADVRRVILDKWIRERRLSKLLRLWVKGLDLDWNRLYGECKPLRMTLPGYPFAKDRYWADAAPTARPVKVAAATAAILHPLLHRNTSTLSEHRYTSTFTGEEPFLKEDSSSGAHVLFATACIEMARAAVLDAASDPSQTARVQLRDIRWAHPVTIDGATDVMVSLSTVDAGQIDFDIYTGSPGQETVHCQGCVDLNAASAPTQLDLSRLGENNEPHQSLVRFKLSVSAGPRRSEPVLPPDLIESALSAWAGASEQWSTVSLQSMQVWAACVDEMVALVREIPAARSEEPCIVLDIDICDLQGHVCVEIRGLTVRTTAGAVRQIRAPAVASAGSTPVRPPAAEPPRVISQRELQQQLTASLAKALYLQASDIKPDKPFVELGLDSIVGVEWVGEINKIHNLRIAATRVYDYPNIIAFASFLEDELRNKPAVLAGAQPVPTSLPAPRPASTVATLQRRAHSQREPLQRPLSAGTGRIAIIGMSGRYPQARNLRELWQNLARGRNSITEIPPSRWDVSRYYDPDTSKPGKIYCKWMGMLEHIDHFDPLFFKISPADAKTMDPQHRLFLEESYKTFEDAGYSGRMLSNQKCGVYLGLIGNEYSRIVARSSPGSVDITGNNYAIGAARVAYFLNLKGPAITVDTACSSSLVAIHLACQGLLSRETDMALAGGVTVYLEPETYMGMCQAGMLSPDGLCKTFDDSANGFVPGEGVGAVLLKRLEDAERDGDFIYGVIVGSGINQDGKTNGITAPSANSQMALERDLYSKHQVHPETISYVEMHGTGTKLGDPIELEALSTVFKEKTQKRNYCALGAVKSNIGHTSGAAGVVGVQKVLLCMQHQTLAPTLNVTKENSLFDFECSPFYICREKRAWETAPGALRRASVSSFGFSGTNAHLILEECPATEPAPAAPPPGDLVILLSARTADQVRQKAVDLLDFIRSRESPASKDLTAMAYTLMTGRDVLDERLGLVVCSLAELAEKLAAFVRGERDIPGACRGKVERDAEGMPLVSQEEDIEQQKQQCIAARELSKLVALWARGLELHWRELYADVKPRRVGLPTYPFAGQRFWAEEKRVLHSSNAALPTARLHPLLHSNSSVLGEHSYSSTFTGDEFFLVPQHTPGRSTEKMLPAAAYLEMARAAVANALPDSHGNPDLHSIVWGRPLLAAASRRVNIALFERSDHQVDFEIYSLSGESQSPADVIVHCQGHAVVRGRNGRARIDIRQLMQQMEQMEHGRIEAAVLPRDRGVDFAQDRAEVEMIYRGDAQLLVQLHLTSAVDATLHDFRLHPLLLDRALHCAAALSGDSSRRAANLSLPHAVALVRIDEPCTKQMFAWVRHAQGSRATDSSIELDVDLCDVEGNVCVQIHGVAYEEVLQRSVELKAPQSPVFAPLAHSAAAKPTEISLS